MIQRIIVFILLCICFTGCTKAETNVPIEFTEQTFYRDETYIRTFKMLYAQTDEINIGFLQGLYTDEEMQTTALRIKKDVDVLDNLFGVGSHDKVSIYTLEATVDGGSYGTGKNAFCTADDLLSGEYHYALIQAYTGCNEPWILYGLCENLFGQEVDYAFLTDYYLDSEDLSILSLFGGRLYTEWNTNEEIEIARGTATSLTKFILDNYDINVLLSGASTDIKTKWLESIKVNKTYSYEYEDELHGFSYSSSDDYSLIITTNNASYMLNPMESENLKNSKAVEKYIYLDRVGRRYIIDYLQENAPKNFNMVKDVFIKNYFLDHYPNSYARAYANIKNEIYIGVSPEPHLHEAVHTMIRSNDKRHYWYLEGIADYFDKIIVPNTYFKEDVTNFFTTFNNEDITEKSEIDISIYNYFIKHGGNLTISKGNHWRLFIDSIAYVNFYEDYVGTMWESTPIYIITGGNAPKIDGGELSYAEACSFTAYLVENYSLEHMLDLCINGTNFDTVFGKSYENLKKEWIVYIGR